MYTNQGADAIRAPDKFELKQLVNGGRHTLALSGDLDRASTPMLRDTVAHIDMNQSTKLVLDLSKLTYIDSCGVRAILETQTLCADCRSEFALLPGQARVQDMFAVCGLLGSLPFLQRPDAGRDGPGRAGD
jgi:anti-sigma B factor antagonist